MTVKATDLDEQRQDRLGYGDIGYFLSPSDSPYFKINQKNGQIRIKSVPNFDREKMDSYEFKVIAKDSGGNSDEPMQEGKATVTIKIEDINDNDPVFESTNIVVEIPEDTEVGTEISTDIVVGDRDIGLNGQVRFVMDSETETFEILPKLDPQHPKENSSRYFGIISLKKKLNFDSPEGKPEYRFKVTAENIEPGKIILCFHPLFR